MCARAKHSKEMWCSRHSTPRTSNHLLSRSTPPVAHAALLRSIHRLVPATAACCCSCFSGCDARLAAAQRDSTHCFELVRCNRGYLLTLRELGLSYILPTIAALLLLLSRVVPPPSRSERLFRRGITSPAAHHLEQPWLGQQGLADCHVRVNCAAPPARIEG